MAENPFPFPGLTDQEVARARATHGTNTLEARRHGGFGDALLHAGLEPMFLLLVAAAVIYFLLGEVHEAWFMLGAILLVSAISLYQDHRSRRALDALMAFTRRQATVLRGGHLAQVPTEDVVMGDLVVVKEGELMPADGMMMHGNDFAVNESVLTGEAFSVAKAPGDGPEARVFRGTQAVGGLAVVRVTAVGAATELGKIGRSLTEVAAGRSPLERQIRRFVVRMAVIGALFFLLVWAWNFHATGLLLDSLLKGLTLAMSILPEEIPVAFTTFMALGAWRLMRAGVLVKHAGTVETLGSATVICLDKTGTITENRMEAAALLLPAEERPRLPDEMGHEAARQLIASAMWASEPVPFDPMEIALHELYRRTAPHDERPAFTMVHEYPLSGRPPMMTHVFEDGAGRRITAAKGATEALLACSALGPAERAREMRRMEALAGQGLRVLAVGDMVHEGDAWPATQQELRFTYRGLVAFHDPPKPNISEVLRSFRVAGIRVHIVTGDNPVTTAAIARQVGFGIVGEPLTGEQVRAMDDEELGRAVAGHNCFTRMFPEAKLRVVKALKARGEVVAMTGDGVNDGPALKAAHIGIAMGRRGSELAREAAELVLLDDDLAAMTEAVAQGRRIYANLKKAVQYIISIHIPIILTVAAPLLLGWAYPHILTPVHVIFLELLMGPTCSIAYESEPMEPGTMRRPPRRMELTFLSWAELRTSIAQGLAITAGVLLAYRWAADRGLGEELTRTMAFTALVTANIALTLVNRSFELSVLHTITYRNRTLGLILAVTVAALFALLYAPPLRSFFHLAPPGPLQLAVAVGIGAASVLWYEAVKAWRRRAARAAAPVAEHAA